MSAIGFGTDAAAESRAAAERGAAFLDEREPGWYRTDAPQPINTSRLDISSWCQCVGGQLYGNYGTAAEQWGLRPDDVVRLGFYVARSQPGSREDWQRKAAGLDALTTAWRDLIESRRAAA